MPRQWAKMAGEVEEDKRIWLGIQTKDTDNMTLLADYHYNYDSNGNRVSKEALTGKTGYQYDTLNRLVKVEYPKDMEEFAYDRVDNRIRRLKQIIQKQIDKELSGDDIYREIIRSSQRLRKSVNSSLGLE